MFTDLYDQMSLNAIGGIVSPTTAFDLCRYPMQEKYESYQSEVLEMSERDDEGHQTRFHGGIGNKERLRSEVWENSRSSPFSVIITDFEYYTRSNAGKKLELDIGLMNHGWSE